MGCLAWLLLAAILVAGVGTVGSALLLWGAGWWLAVVAVVMIGGWRTVAELWGVGRAILQDRRDA